MDRGRVPPIIQRTFSEEVKKETRCSEKVYKINSLITYTIRCGIISLNIMEKSTRKSGKCSI